jgi:two-component system phosphate regulon sensor histidine kinase PhoR
VIGEQNYRVQAQVIRRGGHQFIGLALQDITRLVRLNRARRDMVANISHELRTPIAKIRIIIDSLFHDQEKPKRKDSIASLRAIARETDSLLWLVQEMSDLSMIESGQAIVRMVDVLLSELVDDAIDHVQDISEHKGVILTSHIPDKITVLCDSDLARRVIVNLVHNAIKWSPEGGTVTVNAENSGEEVTISVLDNGPGVAPDAIERIFERFYQVDASRSGGEGTGLGLAICRHIVEAHGGRIWAESNENGAGGRFLFTLLSASESFEETSPEEIPVTDETSESSGKSLPEHAESVKE